MKTYKIKFKSGTEAMVKEGDLSEAAEKLGEIEKIETTETIIFESATKKETTTNPFGYEDFWQEVNKLKSRFDAVKPKVEPKNVEPDPFTALEYKDEE